MKKCPFCAEKIQNEAQICRYCGRELPKSSDGTTGNGGNKKKNQLVIVSSIIFVALVAIVIFFLIINNPEDVYSENFNDSAALTDWDVKTKDQNASVVAIEGGYHFAVDNGSIGSFLRTKDFGDTVITVDLKFLTSEPATVSIICRNLEGGYGFGISNDGQWTLDKSGKMLGSGETNALKDGVNKIKVGCEGQQFTLEINDEMVGSASDPEFSLGEIGLGLSSGGEAEVVFDNLKITGAYTQVEEKEEPSQASESKTTEIPTETPTSQVTSTPTIRPTIVPTLRPTPIPTDQLMIYQTDFEDNDASLSNWKTFAYSYPQDTISTDGYEITTGTSYYRIKASQINQRIYSIYDEDLGTSDVDLSMEMPMYDHGTAGLVCRFNEQGWYQFMFEEPGLWSIRMVKVNEAGTLQFYKLASGYRPAHERMRVECKGDQLTLYFNNILTSSLHDDSFPEGKAGIVGWSFDKTGKVAFIDNFSIKRAEWRESDLTGPAPTPMSDGTIYSTDFGINNDLPKYWVTTSKTEVLGPSSTRKITTYLNDFDPGYPDVEISADLVYTDFKGRTLLCRYSQDGWYSLAYDGDKDGIWMALKRVERGSDGQLKETEINWKSFPFSGPDRLLTLTCSGNQISGSLNGQTMVYAEDSLWQSGRYGFSFWSDVINNPADLYKKYTVKPLTRSGGEKTLLLTDDFENADASKTAWNLGPEEFPGIEFKDGALFLTDNGLTSSISQLRNAEVSMDMEFLENSTDWFSFSCSLGNFDFKKNGEWHFGGANGVQFSSEKTPAPAIKPDKNVITYQCADGQFTFIANGETVVSVSDLAYDDLFNKTVSFRTFANSPAKIDHVTISAISSAIRPEASTLPNQVKIPTFNPGDSIFAFTNADLYADMWCPYHHNEKWYGPCLTPSEPIAEIINPSVKETHYWYDKQYLNDLPAEISIDTTFTGKTGTIGIMCRYSQLGRYEFIIQPDGNWAIRRNTSEWYAPSAAKTTILSNGVSDAIHPDTNQITAICKDNELIFNANGIELSHVKDDLFAEGYAGFFFDSYTPGSFTNLNLKVPE